MNQNGFEPMFACGSMHLNPGVIALILFFVAGWWVSGALAVVNPLLIVFLKVSARFRQINFGCWAFYVVPGIILLLGLYDKIPLNQTPNAPWIAYALAIPFITVFHFVFLLRTRRRIRKAALNEMESRLNQPS